jgi:hypothetical protein
MALQTVKPLRLAALALIGALVAAAGPADAASQDPVRGPRIEGTWLVQITLRNCATGAALGSFSSIVTFQSGGTMSETPGRTAFAAGQRSDGHGYWRQTGAHTYLQRFVALIRFDTPASPPASPGFLAGWQTVTHTVELVDADNLSSSGSNEFFDANGSSYRTGCSTATGQRFE